MQLNDIFGNTSLIEIIIILVFLWFSLSLFGPKLYYKYDFIVDIDASAETVWAAIDSTQDGWRSPSGISRRAADQPNDAELVRLDQNRESEPKLSVVDRILEYNRGVAFSTRIEQINNAKFPVGRDSFEKFELEQLAHGKTRCRISGKAGFRDPIYGLGHSRFMRRYGNDLKNFCETGLDCSEKRKNTTPLKAAIIVAAIAAAIWQFGLMIAPVFLAILIIHELGHAIALKLLGEQVYSISLIPFIGAVTRGSPPKTAMGDALFSLGGVAISFIAIVMMLCAPFVMNWPIAFAWNNAKTELVYTPGAWVYFAAFAAIIINLIQLIPIGFLDGGKVVEAMLSGLPRKVSNIIISLISATVCIILYKLEFWVTFGLSIIFLFASIAKIFQTEPLSHQAASWKTSIGIGFIYFTNVAAYVVACVISALIFTSQTALNSGMSFEAAQNQVSLTFEKTAAGNGMATTPEHNNFADPPKLSGPNFENSNHLRLSLE